jgi:hypothetical protein
LHAPTGSGVSAAQVDGRPVLVIEGADLIDLIAVVEPLHRRTIDSGKLPAPVLSAVIDQGRAVLALAEIRGAGSGPCRGVAPSGSVMVGTDEAAMAIGVSARTVRKWAESGRLAGAVRRSSGWFIAEAAVAAEIARRNTRRSA